MDVDIDWAKWARQFPMTLGGKRCPEEDCRGWMAEDYVRDPATQDHWRGVEALVCQDCGHAERIEDHPAPE